jgi:hypothetical protein
MRPTPLRSTNAGVPGLLGRANQAIHLLLPDGTPPATTMRLPQLLLIASVVLTACVGKQPPTNIQPQSRPTVLGVAELAMGVPSPGAQVGVRAMSASLEPVTGITFTRNSTFNVEDAAGNRYLTTTFAVHNGRATELRNFTVIALARAGGIAGTAITRVTSFAGNDASQRAREVMPAAAMTTAGVVDSLNTGLQILLPDESAALQKAALSAQPKPAIGTNDVVLDYGFVVKNAAGQHVVAPGQEGSLTFSFRVPATDAEGDPYSFNMSFLLATTSTTRVTETLEEQGTLSGASERASQAGAAETRVMPGTDLERLDVTYVCSVRTAVGASATYMVDGSIAPRVSGFIPRPSAVSVPAHGAITALFGKSTFLGEVPYNALRVHGRQTGNVGRTQRGLYSLSTMPTSLHPGELVDVTLVKGSYSNGCTDAASSSIPGTAFQYRVETISATGNPSFDSTGNYTQTVTPHAVAVGNLTNDAYLDIVFAAPGYSWIGLMRYDPTIKAFGTAERVSPVGLKRPTGITLVDVDQDSKLDVLIVDRGPEITPPQPVLRRLSRDSSDKLIQTAILPLDGAPSSIRSGDLNADGSQDVVIILPSSAQVAVLANDGNGQFRKSLFTVSGVDTIADTAAVYDFDADGDMDIALSPSGPNLGLVILSNDGDGTFSQSAPRVVGTDSTEQVYSLAVGDINSDDRPDLVAGLSGGHIGTWTTTSSGELSQATFSGIGVSGTAYGVTLGDWDSDASLDVAATLIDSTPTTWTRSIALFRNDGSGSLKLVENRSFGTASRLDFPLATADVSGDGDLDVIVGSTSKVSILKGRP